MSDQLTCLDANNDCSGAIEYRMAISGTGRSFARCDHHWDKAYDRYLDIQRRYPVHAPADFDPSYAGESWDEDY